MKYKKTIWGDLECPANEIERPYLRKPLAVLIALMFPLLFSWIWILIGICKFCLEYYHFVKAVWGGTPHDRPMF